MDDNAFLVMENKLDQMLRNIDAISPDDINDVHNKLGDIFKHCAESSDMLLLKL